MKLGRVSATLTLCTVLLLCVTACNTSDLMQPPEAQSVREPPELHRPPDLDLKPVDDEAQDGPGEAISTSGDPSPVLE